jgi:hypothetical protein
MQSSFGDVFNACFISKKRDETDLNKGILKVVKE